MRYAVKSQKKIVTAYPLGARHPMELELIREGAIRLRDDGSYELFSQESLSGSGQIAYAGDYFKVDTVNGRHYPYPNSREFFLENHIHLQGDEYEQKAKPLMIWQYGDEKSDALVWLLEQGRLTLREEDAAHYFNAFLWGADLSAARDATLIFYSVDRDDRGVITDISFNFVAKPQFDESYVILP
jgi:hypothetical protein